MLFWKLFELANFVFPLSLFFFLFIVQGTEAIERSSPILTKYWQQPAGTCAHFQHNYKIGGKIDYLLIQNEKNLYI